MVLRLTVFWLALLKCRLKATCDRLHQVFHNGFRAGIGTQETTTEQIAIEENVIESELMFAMESQPTDDPGMGWAESVEAEEDAFGTANQNGREDDAGAFDDFDLAASALELAPDTSGVIEMTEGSDVDSMANLQDSANF